MPTRSVLLSFVAGVVFATAVIVMIALGRGHTTGGAGADATAGVYAARVLDAPSPDASDRRDLDVAEQALASARQAMLTALADHFAERRRAEAARTVQAPAAAPPPVAVPDDAVATTLHAAPEQAAPRQEPAPAEIASADAQPAETRPAIATVPRLEGEWLVTNAVESTRDRSSAGLRFEYRLRLRQQRDRVDGRGARIAKNGRPLPREHQTPVSVSGTVDDGRVVLRFAEHGRRSQREGRFTWEVTSDPDLLDGRFASDATGTIGRSAARRVAD